MSPCTAIAPPRRCDRPCSVALILAFASVACIDTEATPLTVTDCAALGSTEDNVVFVTAVLGNMGSIQCSGVLLTRTLLLTSLGCTMVPNDLADAYGREEPAGARPRGSVFFAGAADAADCSAGGSLEDGSFSTLYGQPLAEDRFAVYLSSERFGEPAHAVSKISRVGATRCSPGIALLQLSAGIGPSALPVRFFDALDDDEPLLLSYLEREAGGGFRREVQLTASLPSSTSSAHSFELAETCPDQSGGAIFSETTGALVGVLDSSIGADRCTTLGPGTAVRLAPFRRLLIEAAEPEKLQIESGPPASNVVLCSPPW